MLYKSVNKAEPVENKITSTLLNFLVRGYRGCATTPVAFGVAQEKMASIVGEDVCRSLSFQTSSETPAFIGNFYRFQLAICFVALMF